MFELMNVIKQQSDELHELLNTPYGTKLFSRVEAPEQNNEEGDNVGESHSPSSNNSRVVSVPVTRSIKPLVANFVNGVHEDEQCIIH
jgi:hypothetical protein